MNYTALERNVIEVLEEQQAKLGFDGGTVFLFYPLSSLSSLLGVCLDENTAQEAINGFCAHVREKLGELECIMRDGRVTMAVPPIGSRYVQAGLDESKFIVRLIRLVSSHRATMEDVLQLFREYSDHIHVERMTDNEEFDYLVYFEEGEPDAFYYCLKEDMGHLTYHRFTKTDYEAFGF